MRLTQLKLAGFKSFVDPTTVPIPGRLIGVVGPNGCGKSNVIDAVRWVLGESSAKNLRGESMQDVIFNGSGTRKPVGRASVELHFDNSEGRAAGQWATYAEIIIKRVMHRDGESHYFINNQRVRRKDITDIFLGTGVGPRAYAIIEQGMISRIIEAKPEELRVFLEEAAGVSRYKDRRRETEQRLKETRDNLLRVHDVRQELDKQIEKLTAQAAVARQYHEYNHQLHQSQNLLSLLRKREAQAQKERWARQVEKLVNELEAETSGLRQAESRLEQARSDYYAASDAVHNCQADVYAAGAEVSRIEQNMQHQRQSRERLQNQIQQYKTQAEQLTQAQHEGEQELIRLREELELAKERVLETREQVEFEAQGLPEAESLFQAALAKQAELQKEQARVEQSRRVEETHMEHGEQAMAQLKARASRLSEEMGQLPPTDEAAVSEAQEAVEAAASRVDEIRDQLDNVQEHLLDAEEEKQASVQALQAAMQEFTRVEARLTALQQLVKRMDNQGQLGEWLARRGLLNTPRLWQGVSIENGWEAALEAALRERLQSLAVDSLEETQSWVAEVPPAALAVYERKNGNAVQPVSVQELTPLSRYVTIAEGHAPRGVLDDWLAGVYALPEGANGWEMRHKLPAGTCLVSRDGHVFTRHGVVFHAYQNETHGLLTRKKEMEALLTEAEQRRTDKDDKHAAAAKADERHRELQKQLAILRRDLTDTQQAQHRLQLEQQKLAQLAHHAAERRAQIERERAEVADQMEQEKESLETARLNVERLEEQLDALAEGLDAAGQSRAEAEAALGCRREGLRAAERAAQEAVFFQKNGETRLSDLTRNLEMVRDNLANTRERIESMQAELESIQDDPMQEVLQRAVAERLEKENALALARDALNQAQNAVTALEEARLKAEQGLDPLREKINDTRLKEQEARLAEEQFAQQLQAANAVEDELIPLIEKGRKAGDLQNDIVRLQNDITALGSVNLAALEELTSSKERKDFLDAQAKDLTEAVETLEAAIHRIDRETRDLLQETYNTVNRNLGELFPTLFGGGQARLILTGEDLLDSGVQIVAQPPGKKNSSIHLLSGGEKALTAIALTFSFFRLNPAPFCMLDEVDAPLDDSNTERFCRLVQKMSDVTQFVYISHNKITMEMAEQLIGVTMQEQGVSRIVAVDIEEAMKFKDTVAV